MLHPLFLPPPPHRNCCWENLFSRWQREALEDIRILEYDSVCVVMGGGGLEVLSQRFAVCSVFQHHVRVRQYLHSDCAFFGHGLVHPNEGHIVVKVIDGALTRKRERREKMKRETWSITRLKARGNKRSTWFHGKHSDITHEKKEDDKKKESFSEHRKTDNVFFAFSLTLLQ